MGADEHFDTRGVSISGGLSDASLLLISLLGFIFIGIIFYVIVLHRQGAEDEKGGTDGTNGAGGGIHDYDDELDHADVGTLNRAQRRARARNRMKRNRRLAHTTAPATAEQDDAGDNDGERPAGEGGGGDGALGGVAENVAVARRGDIGTHLGDEVGEDGVSIRPMTRKERQKAAKAAEREERRRYEEQRREELRLKREAEEREYRERKLREKDEAEKEEEERLRSENEREERERAEYEQWRTMFTVDEVGGGAENGDAPSMVSVQEFIQYAKLHKVVVLDEIATQFRVSTKEVVERLKQLEQDGRVTGIIDDRGKFIYISPEEMKAIAGLIKERGRISLSELADEITQLIKMNGSSHDPDNPVDESASPNKKA